VTRVIVGLDQGTTGSTALVFGADGRLEARASAEITQRYPQPGWVAHDPEELWETSAAVVRRALDQAGAGAGDVAALGITNQRETTVVWDRRTGRALHPAIVWQSRQTADICQSLRAAGHEGGVRARTGLLLDPYFSGTKLTWLLDHVPDLRRRAEGGDALFGTVDSWLLFKLTGGAVHATEPTNASRTLLYDIHERRWHPDLLALFGAPAAMLPAVRPSAGLFGQTAAVAGLPAGVPITGVAGDQQAALYGQGCWERGTAKNTYGTGCFLVMNMGTEPPADAGGLLITLACDAAGAPVYALEGSVFVAGAAVQWLRDELRFVGSAAETEAVATSVPDSLGVHVVPAFAGLGAPYWDMDARGAVLGLTRGAGRAHIVRATLESIAFQTRDVVDDMNRRSGAPLRELRVDGGGTANGFLMQFQADVLGLPVVRPAMTETTAAGAAFLAGRGAGLWSGREALAALGETTTFAPRMDPASRESAYAAWQRAVARVRSDPR
jgi:glycerol kinase